MPKFIYLTEENIEGSTPVKTRTMQKLLFGLFQIATYFLVIA
jgi:hypothetical protein